VAGVCVCLVVTAGSCCAPFSAGPPSQACSRWRRSLPCPSQLVQLQHQRPWLLRLCSQGASDTVQLCSSAGAAAAGVFGAGTGRAGATAAGAAAADGLAAVAGGAVAAPQQGAGATAGATAAAGAAGAAAAGAAAGSGGETRRRCLATMCRRRCLAAMCWQLRRLRPARLLCRRQLWSSLGRSSCGRLPKRGWPGTTPPISSSGAVSPPMAAAALASSQRRSRCTTISSRSGAGGGWQRWRAGGLQP
jgi:hypothetical protein